MKHATLKLAAAALSLFVAQAYAQSGEAGATVAFDAAKASPEEIAAAREARRHDATEAARMPVRGEAGAAETAAPLKSTPQDRAEAAGRRRADALAAYKSGEIHSGEVGQ